MISRNLAASTIIGISVTLLFLAGSFIADAYGHNNLARLLFWHNEVLQNLIPHHNIGTPENPIYEGTPLNILGFFFSIPLGFAIYGNGAYFALRFFRNGT